ncbi:nuclear transport factor 2 family protein [Paraburkholderia sp.]|uniref:nuclear transport factor 2 family protein n=1 Tax=Paraburkholderia sp. TaxID=1926495 RepID=UPI002398A245|nr:nuclear transport factor 2 family protein [Paraburkholderia sp.]MDE1181280.1 nuclear transport factor 2 family protein [Paraburkholderia sp.]
MPYRIALDTYLDAKDNTRAERIADAFAPDAVLTFSLATSAIDFPSRVEGIDGIARTLVSDFGAHYTQCRTYYVCDALSVTDDTIDALPWLVIMREPEAGALRVGHGTYRWHFGDDGGALRVTRLHIAIARMDVVPDADGERLAALQDGLDYPWLSPAVLRAHFDAVSNARPELAFIDGFTDALAAPR